MLKRKNSESDDNGTKRAAVEISTPTIEASAQPAGGDPDNTSTKPNIVSSHKLNVEIDPATFIHVRILLQVKEAVTLIGKGGAVIGQIREASGIRLNVSPHVRGVTERVVNLKGSAEHVAKVCHFYCLQIFHANYS